jgi:hypothetical protein
MLMYMGNLTMHRKSYIDGWRAGVGRKERAGGGSTGKCFSKLCAMQYSLWVR